MKKETPAEAPVETPIDEGNDEVELDFTDDDTEEEMDLEDYAEDQDEVPPAAPISDNRDAVRALVPMWSDEDVDALIIVAKNGKAAIQSFDTCYGATGTKAVNAFRDVFNAAIAPSERDEVKAALQRLPYGDNLLELYYWASGVINAGSMPAGNDIVSTVIRRIFKLFGNSDLMNSVSIFVQPSSETYEMLGTIPDMSKFDNLPNQVQLDLIAEGFTKEEYEMLNDEARDNALECVGV